MKKRLRKKQGLGEFMPSILQVTAKSEPSPQEHIQYIDAWYDADLETKDGRKLVVTYTHGSGRDIQLEVCRCSACRPSHLTLSEDDIVDVVSFAKEVCVGGAELSIIRANKLWPDTYRGHGGPAVRGH